jgi:SEC-C motif
MTGLVGDKLATPRDDATEEKMSSLVKVSRNDPCPCGSGRKYKRCCYAQAAPLVQGPGGELAHALPMSQELVEILERQREKFIARYGREPGPDDPIFVDVPSDDEYDEMVTKAMEQAGVAPQVIYAFRKTGRIITEENAKFVPAAALEAWQHAIDEYEALMEDQETEPQ